MSASATHGHPGQDLAALARLVATLTERQVMTDARLKLVEQMVIAGRLREDVPVPGKAQHYGVSVAALAVQWGVSERTLFRVLKKYKTIPRKYISGCLRVDPDGFAKAMPDLVLKWTASAVAPGAQSQYERRAA